MRVLKILPFVALCLAMSAPAGADPTTTTLHSFCTADDSCTDGSSPEPGLIQDETGALYGVGRSGGAHDAGVVYALVPNADHTHWTYNVIYDFCRRAKCKDGKIPSTALIRDAAGSLYGMTDAGGHASRDHSDGSGVIYRLTPNAARTKWRIALLYHFCMERNCADGQHAVGALTYQGAETGAPYDGVSPLYGVAGGGAHGKGLAFELSFDDGAPSYKVIYSFCALASCADGAAPDSKLTFDGSGNLLGVGIFQDGEIFKLSPAGGGSWNESVVYKFCNPDCSPGYGPSSGVIRDAAGNLYGTLINSGQGRTPAGSLYKLTPGGTFSVLKTFCQLDLCTDGASPLGELAMDAEGTIYGTTAIGGLSKSRYGVVYSYNGAYSVLHEFCSEHACTDGDGPVSGVILGASGNIFGTTSGGGTNGRGTVFEVTP